MKNLCGIFFACAGVLALGTSQAAFAKVDTSPKVKGFSCERLAPRQTLQGTPSTTFRVERLTMTSAFPGSPHKHPGGEIIYLLSGSGANVMDGTTTPLSKDHALVIPPGVEHDWKVDPGSTLTVLAVQFSDKTMKTFKPRNNDPTICRD